MTLRPNARPRRAAPTRFASRWCGVCALSLAALGCSSASAPGAPSSVKACTEEAKVCPDGSAVGRTGPNCEFAPCPGAASASAPPAAPAAKAPGLIGEAKMLDDGTIVLDLRSPALALKRYAPGDAGYAEIVRHLGGLRPGETKGVPPWPDDIDDAKVAASLRAYLPGKGFRFESCRHDVMGTRADTIVVHARCGERPLSLTLRQGTYEVIELNDLGSR